MMLRFRRSSFNGVQHLIFNHGFRQIFLYSTSTSTVTEVNPNFVNYLVDNLGFDTKEAISTTSKFSHNRLGRGAKNLIDFDVVKNADSVIAFLRKIGLQQSHIRNAIDLNPLILCCKVDKTLIPKTDAFKKLGFSETEIAELVSVNPSLYLSTVDTTIAPALQALKELLGSEGNVISFLKKSHRLRLSSIPKFLVPNVALLRSYGIPMESIQKYLHRNLLSFLRKTECFKDVVVRVEHNLGIPRSCSSRFIEGVLVLSRVTDEVIESKKKVFKSFGWTDSHIATLVSTIPSILSHSEDNIKRKLDFLMKEIGYEPSYLASKCCMFSCSLEKRIVPRHKVLEVLKENGLIKKDYALPTAVAYTESNFRKRLVIPFTQVHEVYSKHAGISLEMLTLGSSTPNSCAL